MNLATNHFAKYKTGQFSPDPKNSSDAEDGALTVTFEYDGTNDVYVFPVWRIAPYRLDNIYYQSPNKPKTEDELEANVLLQGFINNAKLDYLDALNFNKDDVKLKDITVKDVYFLSLADDCIESTLTIFYQSGGREVYKVVFDGIDYELFHHFFKKGRETKPVSQMKVEDVQEIVDFISEELSLFSHMHKFKVEGTGVFARFNPEKV
jgi:hypothetical protein